MYRYLITLFRTIIIYLIIEGFDLVWYDLYANNFNQGTDRSSCCIIFAVGRTVPFIMALRSNPGCFAWVSWVCMGWITSGEITSIILDDRFHSSNNSTDVNTRVPCAPNVVGQFPSHIFWCTLVFPLKLLFLAWVWTGPPVSHKQIICAIEIIPTLHVTN